MSKTVGSTTTYYLVDDRKPSGYPQVVKEYRGATLTNVYNYGVNLISQRQPGTSTNYFLVDGHGSTRILTDPAGNPVNLFAYDAYGILIASNSAPQTVYLYCGQQFAPDLGLSYNRARYLNLNTGRFWSSDSTAGDNEDPLSLHKYLYCHDNPVKGIDPSGHDFEALEVGMVLASFDAFNFNFSASRLAATGPVAVNISVDSAKPSTFDPNVVGNMLQSQLSANVFNNLAAGSVQIKVNVEGTGPGRLGWIGSGKSRYDSRVIWVRGALAIGALAHSDRKGKTQIDLEHIDEQFARLDGNINAQFWVNFLAHETIWFNAGGNYDPTIFNPVPDGDIHSGVANPFAPFTVLPASRLTLINEFGFKSAE